MAVEFFKRINYKKGRAAVVSALARKLAVIVWNMITKTTKYNPPSQYLFLDEKRKCGIVKNSRKKIAKFALSVEELGYVTT